MKAAIWRPIADKIVEVQIQVQEATVEATGDVTDPGPLGTVVAIAETLADGEEELAADMLLSLAIELRDEEIELLR